MLTIAISKTYKPSELTQSRGSQAVKKQNFLKAYVLVLGPLKWLVGWLFLNSKSYLSSVRKSVICATIKFIQTAGFYRIFGLIDQILQC